MKLLYPGPLITGNDDVKEVSHTGGLSQNSLGRKHKNKQTERKRKLMYVVCCGNIFGKKIQ